MYSCNKETKKTSLNIKESNTLNKHGDIVNIKYDSIVVMGELAFENKLGEIISINEWGKNNINRKPTDVVPYDDRVAGYEKVDKGVTIQDVCFSGAGNTTQVSVSWTIGLHESVQLLNESSNYGRIKLKDLGFITPPTGTGFREVGITFEEIDSYLIPDPYSSTPMRMIRYKVSTIPTTISSSDYCGNNFLDVSFKIGTDCEDAPSIISSPTTYYIIPTNKHVPYVLIPTTGFNKQIEINYSIPTCALSCKPAPVWSSDMQMEVKSMGVLYYCSDPGNIIINRSNFNAFIINFSNAGTYEYRYRHKINNSSNPTVLWTDWTYGLFNIQP
jgi:hypothetical protein